MNTDGIRRLKQRIARLTRSSSLKVSRRGMRAQINSVIDAWAAQERVRGMAASKAVRS